MSDIVFRGGHKYYEDIEKKLCFDLTILFGAGNEPTLEEFERIFPKPYYNYEEGKDIKRGENTNKVVLRLGRWSCKATSMFTYARVYRNGYQWTPICIKQFRYVGGRL